MTPTDGLVEHVEHMTALRGAFKGSCARRTSDSLHLLTDQVLRNSRGPVKCWDCVHFLIMTYRSVHFI